MPPGPDDAAAAAAEIANHILVLAPVDGDAEALCHVLSGAGFDATACADMAGLAAGIARGAGAVILTQEVFAADEGEGVRILAGALSAQPAWSDLPVILLAGAGAGAGEQQAWNIARRLGRVGNVSILERPLRRTTLLNAMAVALRTRARQYQLRAVVGELAGHRDRLEELVGKRTRELAASIAELHAAERLAALGTLAAGLGHDIANLTLPIRAGLEALANSAVSARADIAAIYQALDHLSSLSAGMRLMALDPQRAEASTPATDLAGWGAQARPVLRAGLPRHVRLECDLPPGLGVPIPRHRLTQAVFNLVQNAGEAMARQKTGTVRVTAEAAPGPGESPLVTLRVSDDGPGMSPEVLARCFEPYFSTKGRALSTGMGLGMVRGIVESAGGTVALDSGPGRGTTFTLTIPAAAPETKPGTTVIPGRTAAVTVNHERTASLACMFLTQLDLNPIRHPGGSAPDAALWVLDGGEHSLIADYLDKDPRRSVVVLGGSSQVASGAPGGLIPGADGRVMRVAASPAAAELRDAITVAGRGAVQRSRER